MRRADRVLVSAVLLFAAWIAVQAHRIPRPRTRVPFTPPSAPSADPPPAPAEDPDRGGPAPLAPFATPAGAANAATDITAGTETTRPSSREPAPLRDVAEIHRRLADGEAGTYIHDILAERDSTIVRWPDRTARPLRVWVQSGDRIPGWNPVFVNQVRDAFTTWQGVGVPVPFTFVLDSSDADVHVRWIDHFAEPISGKTLWARDQQWWIVDANITIALHHNQGEALDAAAVRAIALHEVGHLLGLDHCADTANIMTARVRVRDLSAADRATVRLIYELPPGSVR